MFSSAADIAALSFAAAAVLFAAVAGLTASGRLRLRDGRKLTRHDAPAAWLIALSLSAVFCALAVAGAALTLLAGGGL